MTSASSAREMLIVTHGSPSDPEPQERFVKRLAERVGARTGARVVGVTLAKPGALDTAVTGMTRPLIFPHFMADGWFVSSYLPKRLGETNLAGWTTLSPLGMSETLPALAERRLAAEMVDAGLPVGRTTLVVAAHGSPSNPRPAEVTRRFAEKLSASGRFGAVRVGFVDEEPSLEEAASVEGPAVLLPFFAARAGHVLTDLPEALHRAKFDGLVLPPIGTWDAIPLLVSDTLQCAAATAQP